MSEIRIPRSEVASGTAQRIDAGPTGICLVRIDDAFYAIGDRCSHADVSLSEGDVDTDEGWIECWKHGSAFSVRDGTPQSLPATAPVPVYATAVDGDDVIVTIP